MSDNRMKEGYWHFDGKHILYKDCIRDKQPKKDKMQANRAISSHSYTKFAISPNIQQSSFLVPVYLQTAACTVWYTKPLFQEGGTSYLRSFSSLYEF